MIDVSATLSGVMLRLLAQADRDQAAASQAYLKHDLPHLGVVMPELRAQAAELRRAHKGEDLTALCAAAWDSGVHEGRVIGMLLAEKRVHDLDLFERWLRASGSWAYLDYIAIDLVGREPAEARDPYLDRWSTDADFWMRRASMLALIRGVRDKRPDLERVERFTASMLHEQEFFIRKAIGWLLRELATREPAFVRRWIATYGDRASGLTLREASRKLPNEAGEGA